MKMRCLVIVLLNSFRYTIHNRLCDGGVGEAWQEIQSSSQVWPSYPLANAPPSVFMVPILSYLALNHCHSDGLTFHLVPLNQFFDRFCLWAFYTVINSAGGSLWW